MRAEFLIDYCHQGDWQPQCGQQQSPIDIQTTRIEPTDALAKVQVNFAKTTATFLNNGQNLQLLGSGQALFNQRLFQFVQVHFHADSEHRIDGQTFPLEGHFLFQTSNGQQAVMGIFYRAGKHNPDFDHILNQYDHQQGEGEFSVTHLIPENKSYYHYIGSLTTPPLTEGVEWYLMHTVLEVSTEQIQRFIAIHGRNNRGCQALNNRKILSFKE
ncbi:carbonic anhydrase family protein [Enterococcus dongliensis]|uniref:Carbonic anhydrase n=1 Tax=Enterococcus dongliensis TaxID=2559925 RepID=A0AAP5NJX3_9ENTE|nr:carbonic anhydrase family protein [Enterococcus dongliensis]MDT2596891.1 carbonic anhydrase family protein [Enterococcus dongliensis]MDT2604776.1 carbonic anhydrase family protein [Enterococcus dongliensis]MDT2634707.1 carbonic anhydrase family protein [Enterococcus dongliensis]MDT2637759.1 carbonic anhydrase family protein [Enterococcus dongliensis]MDT2642801.1 carbonic anhydrase family protein [Enterococcus dongliensis]